MAGPRAAAELAASEPPQRSLTPQLVKPTAMSALEDQLCAFTADFDCGGSGTTPGRQDALIWAVTYLTVNRDAVILDYSRRLAFICRGRD